MFVSRKLRQKTPQLSLERALYLAKEAGIFTTKELQTHVIKSPSFSQSKSPFLLEDFFVSMDDKEMAAVPKRFKAKPADPNTNTAPVAIVAPPSINEVSETMHNFLMKAFHKVPPKTFIHGDCEFLERGAGQGTKKRSRVQAVLVRGTGIVRVNGDEDLWKRWPLYYHRFDVLKPFKLTNTAGLFDVYLQVRGGGISGQAVAARLAIARALVHCCGATTPALADCLYEDPRQKISKMAGRNAAFARDKNKQ